MRRLFILTPSTVTIFLSAFQLKVSLRDQIIILKQNSFVIVELTLTA